MKRRYVGIRLANAFRPILANAFRAILANASRWHPYCSFPFPRYTNKNGSFPFLRYTNKNGSFHHKVEAASSSLFVAGWRPAIGWVCGAGCAWNWIGLPMASFIMAAIGHTVAIYPADLGEMMPLLLGMLGIGTLRTVEKIKGVAS